MAFLPESDALELASSANQAQSVLFDGLSTAKDDAPRWLDACWNWTLERKGIENEEGREGSYRFLTTGDPELFRDMGRRFLQLPIEVAEQVEVSALEAAAA